MFQGTTKRVVLVFFAIMTLTGVSSGGCSDGVAGGLKGGDDFDQDDIRASIVKCATAKSPKAVVKIRANTDPSDRTYFVGVNFLDAEGETLDFAALNLDPRTDPGEKAEISEKVDFAMTETDEAGKVASCELDHAF
jgi:hypothetical protein